MKTSPSAFSYDYARVEAVVSQYVPQWRAMKFDAVVAIARGGLAPAVMASTALSLPLSALAYDRPSRRVTWFTAHAPTAGSRILLVEDIAGRGTTLTDCHAFLVAQGFDTTVFALAYDGESRMKPHFGMEIPPGWRAWFPWERESITPAFAATHNQPDRPEFEYASWAIDLDGILLSDLPEQDYTDNLLHTLQRRDQLLPSTVLPDRDLTQLTIITGRPEQDRGCTQGWLHRHGFHGPLVMRDESRYSAAQTAEHKAHSIAARGHTHFIESDAIQALEIARRVTVARVFWWNGDTALAVYAAETPILQHA